MYKIPENCNINILKGETIIQIAFGLNFVSLFFSKGFIKLEGSFATIFENQLCEYDEVYPVKSDFRLLQLLEQTIVEVDISNNRDVLILIFESGFLLKLVGNEAYESYLIKINDIEITV